jgi:hypothetical protein
MFLALGTVDRPVGILEEAVSTFSRRRIFFQVTLIMAASLRVQIGYIFFLLCFLPRDVKADGTGLLGLGKWLYRPTCAHSCRRFIIDSPLVCDDDPSHTSNSHSHSSSSPSQQCLLSNEPFLRTLALCLDTHCSKTDVPLSMLEEYWEGHLATGTLSDTSLHPEIPFHVALSDAQRERDNRSLAFLDSGEELNQTMTVREEDFAAMYNYQRAFEWGENDHGRNR